MKLSKVAGKFDNVVATDAYGTDTFHCQLAPLDLFKIDGVAVRKRQMSCVPGVTLPARGVISIAGEPYLVGTGTPDMWKGYPIRHNYVIQGADGLANLNSVDGKLAGNAPVVAFAAIVFNRYLPDSADSSKYPPQYQVFMAGSESAPADSLIELGGALYLIKDSYVSTSGLRIALANMLDAPNVESAFFGARSYDPITDTYGASSGLVTVLRVKWQEHFRYLTDGTAEYVRGDIQVFVLKSAVTSPKPGDVLTLSDGSWTVVSAQDEGLRWSLHVRRG